MGSTAKLPHSYRPERQAAAARRRVSSSCCDPITSNLYDASQAGDVPGGRAAGVAGLRQPDGAGRTEGRRDRARPGLRRRHRRAALGAARRADRQGLRPRHDRRDAGAGRGEQAQERPHQRRVPQGRDREHPAARQLGGRDHLELRDQPRRATRTRCCARRSACSSPAAGSPSPTWSCAARCPTAIRKSMELWVGCIAGALSEDDYRSKLAKRRVHGRRRGSDARLWRGRRAHVPRADKASMSTLPRGKSTASSSARSSVPPNRSLAARRAAARDEP